MTAQDALRDLRHQMGLSQEKLARLLDVSVVTVCRCERLRPGPSGKWLLKFAALAEEQGRPDLSDVFRGAFAEQLHLYDYGPLLSIQYDERGEPYGVLLQPFKGFPALRLALETSEHLKVVKQRYEEIEALSAGDT